MQPEKRYDAIKYLPPYGPMYIPISQDGLEFYSEGYAVRFYKSDGTEWIANFRRGLGTLDTIIELPDSSNLLVIAGGDCYLINPDNTVPINYYGGSFDTVLHTDDGRAVLYGVFSVAIVLRTGEILSNNIQWYEVKVFSLSGNILRGVMSDYLDDIIHFEFNIDTNKLHKPQDIIHNYPEAKKAEDVRNYLNKISDVNTIANTEAKKPWWKFW